MIFEINPKRVAVTLMTLVVILLIANIMAIIIELTLGFPTAKGFVPMFSMNQEWNIPTLYSALSLFACSVLLGVIFSANRNTGKPCLAWLFLALLFLGLSLDETLEIHEGANQFTERFFKPGGLFYFAWVIPYGIAVLLFALLYIPFLRNLPFRTRNLFLLSGMLYVGGAVGIETLSALQAEAHGGYDNYPYALLFTLEELLEMIGIVVFIYTLLDYIQTRFPDLSIRLKSPVPH